MRAQVAVIGSFRGQQRSNTYSPDLPPLESDDDFDSDVGLDESDLPPDESDLLLDESDLLLDASRAFLSASAPFLYDWLR